MNSTIRWAVLVEPVDLNHIRWAVLVESVNLNHKVGCISGVG